MDRFRDNRTLLLEWDTQFYHVKSYTGKLFLEKFVMSFFELTLFLFIFKIGFRGLIGTEASLIGNSAEVETENLLAEFMNDLKEFSFKKLNPHRLIILRKNQNDLQATKVLLESSTPYFIGTKVEAAMFPSQFGPDVVVLFFIDGFSDFEMNSTFDQLPSNYKCRTLIISMKEDATDQSIASTILSAVKMKLRNVMFARFDGQVIKIYGRVLNANCEQEITLLNKWSPKKGFSKNLNVLGHDLKLNERGCPVVVSTFNILPTMILQEDENKSLHIKGGAEGHLVKAIAEYLNMVPVVKVPYVNGKILFRPNATRASIIEDVAREVASFGIGQIGPSTEKTRIVDFTKSYGSEYVVWTVPLQGAKYTYSLVTSEFSPTTWIMVILSVSLYSGVAYIIPNLRIGRRSSLNLLDVIAMTLNYAIPRPPTGLLCKLLFLLYLNYARIISTAYSTSLSAILTTTTPELTIVDEEGILAAGLRAAGTKGFRHLLDDQISPNSTRAKLGSRYEVMTSLEEALARIADRQDIAYLCLYSTINYVTQELLLAGKPVKFYPILGAVGPYHPAIATQKGSRLTGEIDHIIYRLRESGLYSYWGTLDRISQSSIESFSYNSYSFSRLKSIFVLYLCCLIPAFLVFARELIVSKHKLDWFSR